MTNRQKYTEEAMDAAYHLLDGLDADEVTAIGKAFIIAADDPEVRRRLFDDQGRTSYVLIFAAAFLDMCATAKAAKQ